MFEKLVVSTTQRRKHTTAKFFVGTLSFYSVALLFGFSVSVLVSEPKLADTGSILTLVGPPPMLGGTPPRPRSLTRQQQSEVRHDLNNPMTLDELLSHRNTSPPVIPNIDQLSTGPGSLISEGPPGVGSGSGVLNGSTNIDPAPRPDAPVTKAVPSTNGADNKPLRLTSTVLQGKAIERRTPVYPQLARQIHLQGEVSVEVMISPDGRVESARVVSGHPMLAQCARETAMGWRFGPTLLNNVPVRVTGVITFIFKLNE
jgi:TonB family protein